MRKPRIFFLFIIAVLFNSSCQSLLKNTSGSDLSKHQVNTPSNDNLPENINYLNSLTKEYKINPSDLIDVSVYQESDLSKTLRVSQDGYISYPLIGKVKLAGLSISEAEKILADLLGKDYLVDPQVTVFVKEYHSNKVVVMGEVKNPGSYEFPQGRELTVLEAIALSGGFSNIAALDKTKVIRVENGIQKYIQIKISDIIQSGDKSKDIILKPNDIIFVPERMF